MKNKIVYSLYAIVSLIVVLFAYKWYGNSEKITKQKTIKSLNTKIIQTYQQQFDTNRSIGYIWGIDDDKKKIDTNATEKTKTTRETKQVKLLIKQEEKKICIDKNCYRFLGIYYKAKTPYITFYSKSFTKGLEDFKLHQTLDKTVYIKDINANTLFLADKNSTRKWQFQLFDVNVTKYKPKDTNETNF